MKNPANSNIYEFNANNVLAAYADFVEGNPDAMLLVMAADPLVPEVRTAVESSADRLGFKRSTAWLQLRGMADHDDNVSGAGDDDAGAGAGSALGAKDVMTIVEGLDPVALVALDGKSATLLAEAYRCEIRADAHTRVFGRNVAAFQDFAKMLESPDTKQSAWAVLKRLKPLNS